MKLKNLNVVRISEDEKIIKDLISKGFKEIKEVVKKVEDKTKDKDK
jgi:hypothetical protein